MVHRNCGAITFTILFFFVSYVIMMELSIIIYIQQKINVVTMNQVYLDGSNIVFPTCTTYIVNPGATTIGQADVT